jgi:hypothetical protein
VASRRKFIQGGLAVSALPSAMLVTSASAFAGVPHSYITLERFVYDNHFDEAVETAGHMDAFGVRSAETYGDMTSLWYDDLDLLWRHTPMALAGLTSSSGLFVFETLAADHGMRVIFRGEHAVAKRGRVAHRLSGPADLIAGAAAVSGSNFLVPALAGILVRCPEAAASKAAIEFTLPARSQRSEALISWIIAPRAAALRHA